ncbi:MAG TPA: sigma-54 dependent transcriptional regulator, partial [Saprospiraceae bacterium]|nr:sigma-54 dependent transcriptional regulator [Saprospiraceae bacterium]
MNSSGKRKVLIIDDDRAVCSSLQLLLHRNGFTTQSIFSPTQLLEVCSEFKPQVVLLDMNFSIDTSGKQGLRALQLLVDYDPSIKVILMTGWATVQLAVEGMKLGAKDFIAKPWDNQSLLASIENLFNLDLQPEHIPLNSAEHPIIGQSPELNTIIQKAMHIAKTDASVLITGESGTGKELLAELIHQYSKRHTHPFVKVNLGGISYSLFESELFGHKKGAFTGAHIDRQGRFEVAHKGTIFLDEIGELDISSQVKLLRVLQEKTFEVLGSSNPVKTDV